jgi:hypothetical protein
MPKPVRKKLSTKLDSRLQIERYVDDCASLLGLSDWTISYRLAEDPAPGAEADISPQHGKVAHLRVNKSFFTFSPEYQRNVITHELLHVMFMRQDDTVHSLEKVLGSAVYCLFEDLYTEANEDLVQTLSHVVEKLLPLPDWY